MNKPLGFALAVTMSLIGFATIIAAMWGIVSPVFNQVARLMNQ